MTQDSTDERRRKHMAVIAYDWQSEAMHQNKLLHDALTRAEVAEARLAKAVLALEYTDDSANNGAMTPTYSEYSLRYILRNIRDRARATLTEIKEE
jgi:hypothetical protein